MFSSFFPSPSHGMIIIIIQASPISPNLTCKDQFLAIRFQPLKESKFNHSNHSAIPLGCILLNSFFLFKDSNCVLVLACKGFCTTSGKWWFQDQFLRHDPKRSQDVHQTSKPNLRLRDSGNLDLSLLLVNPFQVSSPFVVKKLTYLSILQIGFWMCLNILQCVLRVDWKLRVLWKNATLDEWQNCGV
jgi:hypothetical protein